ncbi:hypothetical protein [Demequina sp. NBRC 110052]|uniref:hypothetical protein n=1 Tax=Demequina sp. NBRC 110052 TaxID=1570341 RepID=UPI0009FEB11C|nr:hypothetical protein [Demequina sp. NBRC 110052]
MHASNTHATEKRMATIGASSAVAGASLALLAAWAIGGTSSAAQAHELDDPDAQVAIGASLPFGLLCLPADDGDTDGGDEPGVIGVDLDVDVDADGPNNGSGGDSGNGGGGNGGGGDSGSGGNGGGGDGSGSGDGDSHGALIDVDLDADVLGGSGSGSGDVLGGALGGVLGGVGGLVDVEADTTVGQLLDVDADAEVGEIDEPSLIEVDLDALLGFGH